MVTWHSYLAFLGKWLFFMLPFSFFPVQVPVSAPPQPRYYCHECSAEVETFEENGERACARCRETFVEELETPLAPPPVAPPHNIPPFFQHFSSPNIGQPGGVSWTVRVGQDLGANGVNPAQLMMNNLLQSMGDRSMQGEGGVPVNIAQ